MSFFLFLIIILLRYHEISSFLGIFNVWNRDTGEERFQWFIFIMISYKMQTLRNFEKKIEEILIVKIK